MESNPAAKDEGKPNKSVEDRDDLIFELIKERYDGILQYTSTLDTKAASLIGFVSVVVGLIVGGGTFEFSEITESLALIIPYFASIALLLTSIFFGLKAYREKGDSQIVVSVKVLLKKYTRPNVSYSQVLQKTAGTMVHAIDLNEKTNNQKTDDINKSWALLLIGLGFVFALLVIFTLRHL